MRITTAAAVLAPKMRRSWRMANPTVPLGFSSISSKTIFENKTSTNENDDGYGHSRTQNETVPENGKSHRALAIVVHFIENGF